MLSETVQNAQEGFNKVVRADLLDPAADASYEAQRSEQLKMLHLMLTARMQIIRKTFAERARLKERA